MYVAMPACFSNIYICVYLAYDMYIEIHGCVCMCMLILYTLLCHDVYIYIYIYIYM